MSYTPFQDAEHRHLTARTGDQTSLLPLLYSMLHQRETRTELHALTPQRAVELYEDYRRGCMTDVQRAWDELEMYDEDLAVVVDKRQRTLEQMPWRIEVISAAVGDDATLAALAAEQQAYLQARFAAVENLEDAVAYLGMADFHGVAALELTGTTTRMRWEVIEPWLLAHPSRRGPWLYNAEANAAATELEQLDMQAVILREARPISLPAMFLVVAKQHAINGWDGFLEVFGSPSIFAELPPGTPDDAAARMDLMMQRIISDGRGTIPNGTKFTTIETAQTNSAAYQERAAWCREAIITLGTGGQLTVMSAPGSGTLAGNAHENSFDSIMAGTAAAISATINRQFTRRVLAEEYPGQPVLARFALAPEPADERAAMAELLGKITAAGYEMETDEAASELVGMPLRRAPQAATMPMQGATIANACNQHHHDPDCPDASGAADADSETAKLPRPADPPEPEGGWLDNEEDPEADNTGWDGWEEDDESDVENRAVTPEVDDSPLTEDERAAFEALASPNPERMAQRRAAVESALRAAADLDNAESAAADDAIENKKGAAKGGLPQTCGRPGKCKAHAAAALGANLQKRRGGRSSKGNPAGKPNKSNVPSKLPANATEGELEKQLKKGLDATDAHSGNVQVSRGNESFNLTQQPQRGD